MNNTQKVFKNTAIVIASTFLQKGLGLIALRQMAVYLRPGGFGDWNTIFAFLGFFNILTDLGFDIVLVRELARAQRTREELVGNVLLLKLLLGALGLVVVAAALPFMPYGMDLKWLILIAGSNMLLAGTSVFGDVSQADMRLEIPKAIGLAASLLSTIGTLALIAMGASLRDFVLFTVALNIVTTVIWIAIARHIMRARFQFDRSLCVELMKEALPIGVSSLLGTLYYRMDAVLLSVMKPLHDVGLYAATYRLTETFNIIPGALMMSIFPLMASIQQEDNIGLTRAYERGMRYLLIVGLPLAISVTVLAPRIITLIYSAQYAPAGHSLAILIWAEVFMFVNPVIYNTLIVAKKQKSFLQSSFLMAMFNLGANYLVIPRWSFLGSSMVTVATEAIGFILGLYWLYSRLDITVPRSAYRITGCAMLFAAIVLFTQSLNIVSLIVLLPLSYLAIVIGLRVIPVDEITSMWTQLRARRVRPQLQADGQV